MIQTKEELRRVVEDVLENYYDVLHVTWDRSSERTTLTLSFPTPKVQEEELPYSGVHSLEFKRTQEVFVQSPSTGELLTVGVRYIEPLTVFMHQGQWYQAISIGELVDGEILIKTAPCCEPTIKEKV